MDPCVSPNAGQREKFPWKELQRFSRGARKRKSAGDEEEGSQKMPPRGLIGNQNGRIETSRIFGRQKGWGAPDDLESAFFDEDGEALRSM